MSDIVGRCLASSRRGVKWALAYLNENGSFAGSETSIQGPYKGPQSLLITGNVLEADRVLNYAAQRFYADGSFNTETHDRGDSSNYRNAWLCWGAQSLGAFDLSCGAADFLQGQQSEEAGGIALRCWPKAGLKTLEWGTTAIGVIAFLSAGRLDAAIKCGGFLLHVLDAQPQPDVRFFLRTTWQGELLVQASRAGADLAVVDLKEPAQIYWYFGVGVAALGNLYIATREQRWLDAARRVFELTTVCHPDVYRTLTSAKVGWGASILYRITGEKRFAEVATAVADYVMGEQTPEGLWLRKPQYNSVAEQPFIPSLDTTLERCLWLFETARSLAK